MSATELSLLLFRVAGFIIALQLPIKRSLPGTVWGAIAIAVFLLCASNGPENSGLLIFAKILSASEFSDIDVWSNTWVKPDLLGQNIAIGLAIGLIANVVGYAVLCISSWLTALCLGQYFELANDRRTGIQSAFRTLGWVLFGYLLFSVVGFVHVTEVFTSALISAPLDVGLPSSMPQALSVMSSIVDKSIELGLLCMAPLFLVGLLVDVSFAVVSRYSKQLATAELSYTIRQPLIIFAFATMVAFFSYALTAHTVRSLDRARDIGGKILYGK